MWGSERIEVQRKFNYKVVSERNGNKLHVFLRERKFGKFIDLNIFAT
jgi:hypothetical protein